MKRFVLSLLAIILFLPLSQGAEPAAVGYDRLQARIEAFRPDPANPHDRFVLICVNEALQAGREGNYGVGACLVRDDKVVIAGHNHVHTPYRRGDLHAEMWVLAHAEDLHKNQPLTDCVLYTSVEPCVMCFARCLGSGVPIIYYASEDGPSGMVHLKNQMPPGYAKRIQTREFILVECSPELKSIAEDIYALSFTTLGTPSISIGDDLAGVHACIVVILLGGVFFIFVVATRPTLPPVPLHLIVLPKSRPSTSPPTEKT